jgi:AcrR family transcriptional regulator
MMPLRPFAAEPRTRREQLMAVAARLFAVRGFHGVTVDDIGAELELSGPALYHHFRGKEALLGEVLIAISDQLLGHGAAVVAMASDPAAALASLVGAHVEFALDRPELITVQYRDLLHASPGDQHRVRDLQGRYVDLWIDAVAGVTGDTDRLATSARVHGVFGLINSTPHSLRLDREAMSALLTAMATAALQADGG